MPVSGQMRGCSNILSILALVGSMDGLQPRLRSDPPGSTAVRPRVSVYSGRTRILSDGRTGRPSASVAGCPVHCTCSE